MYSNLFTITVEDEGQEQDSPVKREAAEPWIGLVPVEVEQAEAQRGSQETFAAAVVSKMKRALVLGASALLILALNQNTIREMDLSQVLSKPVVVIQTSENVTKLIGALLRGLRATAKITYKSILQDNLKYLQQLWNTILLVALILCTGVVVQARWQYRHYQSNEDMEGATLTLWSSCGRSRSGLYGEWQGVICTGETNSQVQKYLQQLWNTILLVALILCTGVVVQARWQYRHYQSNEDMELHPKHDIVKHLAALKTRQYHPLGAQEQGGETENCAVCLEQFHKKQCLRVLPCLHEFHRDCVDPWLLLQQTCPLCKRSILGEQSTRLYFPMGLTILHNILSAFHIIEASIWGGGL
ncbi:UNVERIFIED_CONTAM: hypothetical protein FKN15_013643 [Acipenser sinensis]